MNPAVYGSIFFCWGFIVLYILYTLLQCWWMEASSLYSGLSITITHSLLLESFPSWLLGWALVWWREKDHYTGPHLFGGFFFSKSRQNIYGQTQKCIAKNHRLSFLAEQICTRSGARFLLTRKIKKKKRFYLCGTQSTSCAMTQTGYTRANIREIHMRWQKINKMRVLFLFFIRNGIAVEATNM